MCLGDFLKGSRCRRLLFLADINDIGDKLPSNYQSVLSIMQQNYSWLSLMQVGCPWKLVSIGNNKNWNLSALSETKRLFRLFRLFRLYTETESFGVSIEPKQQKSN